MNRRPLKKIAAEIATALKLGSKSIIDAGRLLIEAQEQLDETEKWLLWLEANFSLSIRSAQRYQSAADFALEYDTVSHAFLRTSALYALVEARRAGHSEAVRAALAEAKDKWVGGARVREIVAALPLQPDEAKAEEGNDEAPSPDTARDEEQPPREAGGEPPPDDEGRDEEPPSGDAPAAAPSPDGDRPPPTPPPALNPRQAAQLSKFETAANELLGLAARSAREFLDTGISDFDLQTAADFLHRVAMEKEKLKAAGSEQGGDAVQMEEAKS